MKIIGGPLAGKEIQLGEYCERFVTSHLRKNYVDGFAPIAEITYVVRTIFLDNGHTIKMLVLETMSYDDMIKELIKGYNP
jgi:hypothetical protein